MMLIFVLVCSYMFDTSNVAGGKKHPAGPFAAHLLSCEDMNFMSKNVHLLDGIIPLRIPLINIPLHHAQIIPFEVSIYIPLQPMFNPVNIPHQCLHYAF